MRKSILFAFAAIIVLCLAVYFLLQSPSFDSTGGPDNGMQIIDEEGRRFPAGGFDAESLLVSYDPEVQLERYLAYARYPDFSRPLTENHRDLLNPHNAARSPTPLVQTGCLEGDAGKTCDPQNQAFALDCRLEAESAMAIQKRDFAFTASCVDPGTGVHLDLSNFAAKVVLEKDAEKISRPGPIHFADDGSHGDAKAGDGVYRIIVRLGPQDWGWMTISLEGEYRGARVSTFTSEFFSTPHSVAEFAQPIQAVIQDGNLAVRVPVQVEKAGYYELDANLTEQAEDQRPVARAYVNGELKAGRNVVEFIFFGKILRDRDIDGPYVLKNLRGRRNNEMVTPADLARAYEQGKNVEPRTEVRGQPGYEYIKNGPEFVTDAYAAAQFSNREWDSAEKRERIAMLEEAVRHPEEN